MGRHRPLPSDPTERAAEKRRRFAAYRSAWKKRRRAAELARKISAARGRVELLRAAKRAHIDLCVSCALDDMSNDQLRAALQFAKSVT